MIHYTHFTLENGLPVYVHEDHTTPMAAFNLLYNVGSRDEDPDRTGFAHLFEHLMFGGSAHIPSYDTPLQQVGGENNAFTSPDLTNYYITLPAANIETAFWLESDRMLSLSFDPQVLEVQRNVVIEEFKQRYLNQPYGDAWLKLRPLAYRQHPYRWATIGKDISHIENATEADVRAFFFRYYVPSNAILVVAGDVTPQRVQELSEKWFGPIPGGTPYHRQLPAEPAQTQERRLEVSAPVPLNALYRAYHMGGRYDDDFQATDLLADVLGRGKSSRLHRQLVKENPLFSQLTAYPVGSLDPGLFVIQGTLNPGVSMQEAEAAIDAVIDQLTQQGVSEEELTKVKNQAVATLAFAEVELLNRAMNLAFAAHAGDAEYVNTEAGRIEAVGTAEVLTLARRLFRPENRSTLLYMVAGQDEG